MDRGGGVYVFTRVVKVRVWDTNISKRGRWNRGPLSVWDGEQDKGRGPCMRDDGLGDSDRN